MYQHDVSNISHLVYVNCINTLKQLITVDLNSDLLDENSVFILPDYPSPTFSSI